MHRYSELRAELHFARNNFSGNAAAAGGAVWWVYLDDGVTDIDAVGCTCVARAVRTLGRLLRG